MPAPMIDYALLYARAGWAVFPLTEQAKLPIKNTSGFKDATLDPKTISKMWKKFPNANIGIATGKISGILVVDIDVKNCAEGDLSLETLEKQYGALPKTLMCQTPSGGCHYYFQYPNVSIGCSQGKLGKGIDIRSDGGYVVAPPSIIVDKEYVWEASRNFDDTKPAPVPQWILDLLTEQSQQATEPFKLPTNIPRGEQDKTMFRFACSLKGQRFTKEQVFSALKEALSRCPQDPRDPFTEQDIHRWVNSAFGYPLQSPTSNAGVDVKRTRDGEIRLPTWHNALLYMERDPQLEGIFRYNEFASIVEIAKLPPWGKLGDVGHRVQDEDILFLRRYMRDTYLIEFPVQTLSDAVDLYAQTNSYDPVKNYLNGIKWDTTPRLEKWLVDYLGCEDNAYTRHVGAMTLVAACARVNEPGVKYDYMLILEGEQGIGKTRTASILGGQWYREISLTDRTKDTVDKMLGAWIIEVAELAVFKKRDIESLKAFITNQIDTERLPYHRRTNNFARRNIFIGTINPDNHGYLSDTSGNRRFLPVRCGKTIDMASLQRDRDQLWAEAWHRYKQGFKLWIEDKEVAEIALENQAARETEDEWQAKIEAYLDEMDRTTGLDIWVNCLQGFASDFDRFKQMRVADCLRRLKWDKKTIRINGKTVRGYYNPRKWNPKSPWNDEEEWTSVNT